MSNFSSLLRAVQFFNNSLLNNSQEYSNKTITTTWTPLTVLFLFTFIFGLLGNLLLLVVFLTDHSLRSPFDMYLINLILAELLLVGIQYPMDIIFNLHRMTWLMGRTTCTLYLYLVWVQAGVVENLHMLIALNRVWAIVQPISYRTHHSVRVALLLCLGIWVYVNLSVAPGWLLDALYYGPYDNEVDGCALNVAPQIPWQIFTMLVIFDFPMVVMILASGTVIYRKQIRQKINPARAGPVLISSGIPMMISGSATITVSTSADIPTMKQKSHGNLVLLLLTMGFLVSWMPGNVIYTLDVLFGFDSGLVLNEVSQILVSFQPCLDPVLFTMALPNLRRATRAFILHSFQL